MTVGCEEIVVRCWQCKSELIWGGEHMFEDYGIDGDGIVSNLSCSNPDCETDVLVYHTINNEEEE